MTTSAVLFDLAGTAPDLGDALNRLLAEEGRTALTRNLGVNCLAHFRKPL